MQQGFYQKVSYQKDSHQKGSYRVKLVSLQLLLVGSLIAPLASCAKRTAGDPDKTLYTEAQYKDRDSANRSITSGRRNAITEAVAKASPAIVGINVTEEIERQVYDPYAGMMQMDPFFRQFFGGGGRGARTQKYQVRSLGSGFLISKDGYILTNDHVAGNGKKIIVTTTDGAQYDAKLIGTDATTDICLLKIESKAKLPYLELGNSDDIAIGEWAIALGNPFGLFDINDKPTVTVGVISNLGMNLGIEGGDNQINYGMHNYRGMIQTDAAISSGNSGGPLVNINGEVVGINAVIRSTAQSQEGAGSIGLGFAIPINKVKVVIEQLRNGEKVNRNFGDFGFRVQELSDEIKEAYHITGEIGVVVSDQKRGGPSDQAGLEVGDLITAIDNDRVRRPDEMQSIFADHKVGDTVTLKVTRGGTKMQINLRLNGK